ncbi:hypothetical protein Dda_4695 [Drechslerella dactyloides]|uniref:Phosphoglycerate mutase-like protein n=1 Tax=Drechslerella dactyloides TaxID=74499 RepID=A0AAD6NJC4_DREDA|nr:hypothetical protein Dda_4695 [Drechslerella dactyloides]
MGSKTSIMKANVLALVFGLSISAAQAAETILGVYILSRHGDRTDKSHPPTKLTNLGYSQILTSGEYYRNRYVSATAPNRIFNLSSDEAVNSQISVSTTDDTVLLNSAQAFLQGLYPPVGVRSSETLRDGTVVAAVNGGYQLIPVHVMGNGGANKEDATWLQGTSGCAATIKSSKAYADSQEFKNLKNETEDFYHSLEGVWAETFSSEQSDFTNAYAIYDVVNYAGIHNATIPSANLLTYDAFFQLRTLADKQQWNLAFNASDSVRAIAGATFAADVVSHLEAIISSGGSKPKLGVQFNAYGTFLSFFALANLPAASEDFYGLPDYGSSMAFELFTNELVTTEFPKAEDISVRFLFHNGSTVAGGELRPYPLFGQEETEMSWTDFAQHMNEFAVSTTEQWCTICGNEGGMCAGDAEVSTGSTARKGEPRRGLSSAASGALGALCTLVVILVIGGLAVSIGGLAVVRKKDLRDGSSGKQSQHSYIRH